MTAVNTVLAAALICASTASANAAFEAKPPLKFQRARCRQSDGWLNVRPEGFSAHETDCKLQSASPNRSGEYRTQFKCRGEGMIWTAYYWIGLDARDPRRLFLNE